MPKGVEVQVLSRAPYSRGRPAPLLPLHFTACAVRHPPADVLIARLRRSVALVGNCSGVPLESFCRKKTQDYTPPLFSPLPHSYYVLIRSAQPPSFLTPLYAMGAPEYTWWPFGLGQRTSHIFSTPLLAPWVDVVRVRCA